MPGTKGTRRVALQPAHASSSALNEVLHRPVTSCSSDLDCQVMKSIGSVSERPLRPEVNQSNEGCAFKLSSIGYAA